MKTVRIGLSNWASSGKLIEIIGASGQLCYTGVPVALGERSRAWWRFCLRHKEAKNHDAAKVGTGNPGAITDSWAAGAIDLVVALPARK